MPWRSQQPGQGFKEQHSQLESSQGSSEGSKSVTAAPLSFLGARLHKELPQGTANAGISGAAGTQGAAEVPKCPELTSVWAHSSEVRIYRDSGTAALPVSALGWRNFGEDVLSLGTAPLRLWDSPHSQVRFVSSLQPLQLPAAGAQLCALLNPSCSDSGFLCLPW